jgi:hypothetical protein
MLQEQGWTSEEQLAQALARQRKSKQLLGRILVEMGAVTRSRLVEVLQEQLEYGRKQESSAETEDSSPRAQPSAAHQERLVSLVPRLPEWLERGQEPRDVLYWLLMVLSELSGCESLGLRWRAGEDYPYYVTRGFGPDFLRQEKSLCDLDAAGQILRHSDGSPRLACLCGAVVQGQTDPAQPHFTPGGSFWTNRMSEVLRSTPPSAAGIAMRDTCQRQGYQSVGLVPLRAEGETYGLIQLNSRASGRFTAEQIASYERLAAEAAAAAAAAIEKQPTG